MAEQMQVKVGVTGDTKPLKEKIKSIQADPITIKVDADTKLASSKIDTFIKNYRNKDIKLTIGADFKTVNAAVSGLDKNAAKLKKAFSDAFKGVNISKSFNASHVGTEFDKIEAQLKNLKNNYKLDWNFVSDTDSSQVIATITDVNGVAQKLYYTLHEINGQRLYVLDNVETSGIVNAQKQLEQLSKQLSTLRANIENAFVNNKIDKSQYVDLNQGLDAATANLKELSTQSNITQDSINELSESAARVKSTFSSYKSEFAKQSREDDASAKELAKDLERLDALHRSFNEWMANNPKAQSFGDLSSLQEQLNAMKQLADATKNIDHDAFTQLEQKIKTSVSSAKQFGQTGLTAFGSLTAKAKELATYLTTSMTFMYIAEGLRSVVDNVVELDSAMTELKKTTDGSAQSYSNFLTTASSIAQDVGAKVSDVVQSAAEWSRSGYGLSKVADLAKASTMYVNVSEYENVTDATTSLISTMKAFGVESSNVMTILDAFNSVGNTTATTSQGLGDAMMRSASALSVAGNSMEESIGLIVAAKQYWLYVQKCA